MPKSSFEEGFCELLMTPEWQDLEKHLFGAVEMAYAFGWASAGGPLPDMKEKENAPEPENQR